MDKTKEAPGWVTGECTPRPMAVRDLRCGDVIHVNGYFGVDHWFTWGPARESYPVPGKYHVTRAGQGTHSVYTSLDEIVLVCDTVKCSSMCAYEHR